MGFSVVFTLYMIFFISKVLIRKSKRDNRIRKVLRNRSLPFYKWDLRRLNEGDIVPWKKAMMCPVFSHKNLKKLNHLFEMAPTDGSEHEMSSLRNNKHECIDEGLICVFYTGDDFYKGNMDSVKVQGVLTICPVCKKQVDFNWTSLN